MFWNDMKTKHWSLVLGYSRSLLLTDDDAAEQEQQEEVMWWNKPGVEDWTKPLISSELMTHEHTWVRLFEDSSPKYNFWFLWQNSGRWSFCYILIWMHISINMMRWAIPG